MRIAVGGIHTECSTYSPVLMAEEDFRVLRGQALLDADYFSFMKAEGVEHLPLAHLMGAHHVELQLAERRCIQVTKVADARHRRLLSQHGGALAGRGDHRAVIGQ